jgi:hypothetical protein
MTFERATSRPFSFTQRLREIGMFFQGKDPVHQTMRRTARRLERVGIPYAVVGGMAVNANRYRRTTGDVNLLLTEQGFNDFRARFVGKNYSRVPGRPFRLLDRTSEITVDILVTGLFPGSGDPGPIAYPDPDDVSETIDKIRVLNLEALIQLKLAARRFKDFGDVVELIRFNKLDESFVERLHTSVRGDYIECLEEKRREDLYEARRTWPPKRQSGTAEEEKD